MYLDVNGLPFRGFIFLSQRSIPVRSVAHVALDGRMHGQCSVWCCMGLFGQAFASIAQSVRFWSSGEDHAQRPFGMLSLLCCLLSLTTVCDALRLFFKCLGPSFHRFCQFQSALATWS